MNVEDHNQTRTQRDTRVTAATQANELLTGSFKQTDQFLILREFWSNGKKKTGRKLCVCSGMGRGHLLFCPVSLPD